MPPSQASLLGVLCEKKICDKITLKSVIQILLHLAAMPPKVSSAASQHTPRCCPTGW